MLPLLLDNKEALVVTVLIAIVLPIFLFMAFRDAEIIGIML